MNLRAIVKSVATAAGVLLAAAVALFFYGQLTYSSSYLLLPDNPHALAPVVKVKKVKKDVQGGFYFVDVVERRATLSERYLPFLRRDATLVSQQEIGPPNINDKERARLDAAAMAQSKRVAEAVALRQLGYKVVIRPRGALVEATQPGSPASKKLQPGDRITAVDGTPTLQNARLSALVSRHRIGERVRITFSRKGRQHTVTLRTVASPFKPHASMIGVSISQAASVKLPIKVAIDAGNVGGPSAGLAFALELTDKLGRDIDRGYRVAATGELFLDGSVGAIGGVKQKVIGARRAGIEIMLVPVDGDNAREARRYAGNMKIVPVTSFQQALHALATAELKH
ncbi:MAG: YlbL family protein [Gaiellaceae bacterium]